MLRALSALILMGAIAAQGAQAPTAPPPNERTVQNGPVGSSAAARPRDAEPARAAPPARDRDAGRGAEDGDGPSRSGRRAVLEQLTAEEIDEIVEVAGRISPEWGEALRTRRREDPEALREAIAAGGPRLMGLVVLKRNHPELFELRVEDLRLQNELRAVAQEYRAVVGVDLPKTAELEAMLRQKVERQVDLDLRARALELKALDAQLRRMVDELSQETRDREVRIDRVLADIKAGEDPRPLVRPGLGPVDRDGRGPRGMRRPGGTPPGGADGERPRPPQNGTASPPPRPAP